MTAVTALLNYLLESAGPALVKIGVAVAVAGAIAGALCRRIGLADTAITTLVRCVVLGFALGIGGLELWSVLVQATDAGLQWWPVLATDPSAGAAP